MAGGIARRVGCVDVLVVGGVSGILDSLAPPPLCLVVGVSAGGSVWVVSVVCWCEED